MDPLAVIFVVMIGGAFTVGVLYDRRLKTGNTPKWAALAKVVGGSSTATGVTGSYQGRGISAGMSQQAAGPTYHVNGSSFNVSDQLWVYMLRMGAATVAERQGKSFEVKIDDKGQHTVAGDAGTWQQVLAACGAVNFAETGFTSVKFSSNSGEVSGTMVKVALSLSHDVKLSHFTTFDTGPVPTTAQFQAQLDLLVRIAEANKRVNTAVA